jgi:hypothetical protein
VNDRDRGQEPQPSKPLAKDHNREQAGSAREEGPSLADKAKALWQDMQQGAEGGMKTIDKFWGQDARAWFRQGLHELQEATVAFPGQTPIAREMPYGGIGQPPPSTVARAIQEQSAGSVHGTDQAASNGEEHSVASLYGKDSKQTYSIDQLREKGREINRSQEQEHQRDRGHEHGR